VHILESVRFLRPHPQHVLLIGLGTGALASAIQPFGIKVDAVEIDPQVVRLARQYFRFSPTGEVFAEDARTFLRHTDRKYDVVVHDTFTGGVTPEHLLSVEVVTAVRRILQPQGVLVLNFPGYDRGPKAAGTWAAIRTLRTVFPAVRAFRDGPSDEASGAPTNLIFFASDSRVDFSIPSDARFENQTCERTIRSFPSWEVLDRVPDGFIITDEHNPLARLQLPIAEAHFHAMKELLPAAVWRH